MLPFGDFDATLSFVIAYFAFRCTCARMANCADCAGWACAQRAIFMGE